MISIEYALDKYTDLLNSSQNVDLEYFEKELSHQDYIEFIDEISIIRMIKSNNVTNKFHDTFKKLNEYKETLYNFDNIVNFRGKDTSQKTIDKIDEIFKKEFEDD